MELKVNNQDWLNLMQRFCRTWTTIIGLLFASSPFAIFRRIRSVIINAFYSVKLGRFSTHVCNEVCEAVSPLITNINSSSSVICKIFNVSIVASRFNMLPCSIFRPMPSNARSSVLKILHTALSYFFYQASTARCITGAQISTTSEEDFTAVALTFPKPSGMSMQDKYLTEFLPCHLYKRPRHIFSIAQRSYFEKTFDRGVYV